MSEKLEQDLEIERLLEGHLERCLGGQVGRARVAFAEELRRGRRRWVWLSAGAAMAAGLAIAWGLLGHRGGVQTRPDESERIVVSVPDSILGPTPAVQGASWSGFKDAGLVVVEDQPMRQWKRTVVEEVQWYDADSDAVVKTRTPREQVYFIGMRTD
jgi:hypothetical protein